MSGLVLPRRISLWTYPIVLRATLPKSPRGMCKTRLGASVRDWEKKSCFLSVGCDVGILVFAYFAEDLVSWVGHFFFFFFFCSCWTLKLLRCSTWKEKRPTTLWVGWVIYVRFSLLFTFPVLRLYLCRTPASVPFQIASLLKIPFLDEELANNSFPRKVGE